MKKYIVHYIINGNILCKEVEEHNIIAAAARSFGDHGITLDQLVAINEKPFILRVVGCLKSLGVYDARIHSSASL